MTELAVNIYKLNNPLSGTIVDNKRITGAAHGLDNDVRHIVIRFDGNYPYVPGQSVGIIPPGVDSRSGKPNGLRLYSIASTRKGDKGDGKTVSICVVRHFFDNPKTGQKRQPGVASNYLCDLKPNDQVKMTGPAGKHFVLPDDFLDRDIVFVATGTGIAPFRGMLIEMFEAGYKKKVCLYLGVPYKDTILYDNEFKALAAKYPNFHYSIAISREETNPYPNAITTRQNKMYVQVRMYEDRELLSKIFSRSNSLIYLCGLKGMEDGIYPLLNMIGKDLNNEGFAEFLRSEKRLLVEVY